MEAIQMKNLFDAVMKEDVPALLSLFHQGEANLVMPSFGLVANNRIFTMLVHKIANRFRYLHVSARALHVEKGTGLLVAEYMLSYLFYDEERQKNIVYDTPTALLCDLDAEGKIERMIVYTDFDAFVGKPIIRPAIYNARSELREQLPQAVQSLYDDDTQRRYELCRVHTLGERLYVEENALFTKGEICTPQAHLSVFVLGQDGSVKQRCDYGGIVWDFKLWPTLY